MESDRKLSAVRARRINRLNGGCADFVALGRSITLLVYTEESEKSILAEDTDDISGVLSFLIVLWPAVLCAIGFLVYLLALLNGCKLTARGPEECMFLGTDFGEVIYPLWGLGIYLVYAFLWIPVGLIILAIARYLKRNSF
jgi:hypothetical protein